MPEIFNNDFFEKETELADTLMDAAQSLTIEIKMNSIPKDHVNKKEWDQYFKTLFLCIENLHKRACDNINRMPDLVTNEN